jgi:hypothetical protein
MLMEEVPDPPMAMAPALAVNVMVRVCARVAEPVRCSSTRVLTKIQHLSVNGLRFLDAKKLGEQLQKRNCSHQVHANYAAITVKLIVLLIAPAVAEFGIVRFNV